MISLPGAEGLIAIHLALECIGLDRDGLMVRGAGPEPDEIPRFYVAQHARGHVAHCRFDVPPEIRGRLLALQPAQALVNHSLVSAMLSEHAPCPGWFAGKCYVFPGTISAADYPDVDLRVSAGTGGRVEGRTFVVVLDREIVSFCRSAREDDAAGEAWVETLPEHRGRGYGRQVVAAWAHDLQRRGKIPFYSHRHANHASAALARGLRLVQYAVDAAYR